ncbi:MAG: hypothetical protein CO012_11310 [Syntrophobacterales bacterium CG_4_8_14_3_um_filter_49_14]|nr:MAG: hypothetical protein COX52_11495 [Syntrophobacterales bacterium CG23_combo_of_CG06-09_8_20_14_all_48_27]PJC72780.1 MAG: hypothetical protein CO012_11310 [Syntrophobacterales bacterium CG_4_8_14_3_um_filter_49_14]
MDYKQLKRAIFLVWLFLSAITLLVIVSSAVFSMDTLNAIIPQCEWKVKYNQECPLCGMTRGFIFMSHGRFSSASMVNSFSPWLYSLLVINDIVVLLILFLRRHVIKLVRFPLGVHKINQEV